MFTKRLPIGEHFSTFQNDTSFLSSLFGGKSNWPLHNLAAAAAAAAASEGLLRYLKFIGSPERPCKNWSPLLF